MIISRAPFRVSFLGGRTDLPAFYQEEEGAVLSATIAKYMQIVVRDSFDETFRLSYGQTEIRSSLAEIEHKIIRAVLGKYAPRLFAKNGGRGLEILSVGDVPPGTGLGSSSAFTVSLLHAIHAYLGSRPNAGALAAEASHIEIEELKEPIGKQDQYASAYGGLRFIRFLPSGEVAAAPIACSATTRRNLQASLLLFYTGITRSASEILSVQNFHDVKNRESLREMKRLAYRLKDVLEQGRPLREFGDVLDHGWNLKKTVGSGITAPRIDEWYERARAAGAWGGKILGAGGGGFLMMMCAPEKQAAVKAELKELRTFPVVFENRGSQILFADGSGPGTGSSHETSNLGRPSPFLTCPSGWVGAGE